MRYKLPYGMGELCFFLPDTREVEVGTSLCTPLQTDAPALLVRGALANPIASPPLTELARGKRSIVVLCSDHTRPVPSRELIPPMLSALRAGAPEAEITLLIATGCHRESTREELLQKFGEDIWKRERIVIHRARAEADMVNMGPLPSGRPFRLNRVAAEADLLLAEGLIEPHFFAGYSGGCKSVLPGVSSWETVYCNHSGAMIADENARQGLLAGNRIHEDMEAAALRARLRFILNVVCDQRQRPAAAFAGAPREAHAAGVSFAATLFGVRYTKRHSIVITSNNGYPLDQNLYQAVKGMATAERVAEPGGVIIIAAECRDGVGGESFQRLLSTGLTPAQQLARFQRTADDQTLADQWQAQILLRILQSCRVILVSSLPASLPGKMGLLSAPTVEEAVSMADSLLGRQGSIALIPNGVSALPQTE